MDTLAQGQRPVRHDQVLVEVVELAEAAARRARAERRVERERARLQLVEGKSAVDAGVELGEGYDRRNNRIIECSNFRMAFTIPSIIRRFDNSIIRQFDYSFIRRFDYSLISPSQHLDFHHALAGLEGELDRVGEARAVAGQHEAVDDDVDAVGLLLVERRHLFEQVRLAIDAHAREAVALQRREDVLVATLLSLHDWGEKEDLEANVLACGTRRTCGARGIRVALVTPVTPVTSAAPVAPVTSARSPPPLAGIPAQFFWQPQDRVDDLLGGLAGDGLAALRAVRCRDRAIEDAQVVVDLRDGRDDGARIAACRALLDGDRRGQALNLLDVRLLHAVEELPRVSGQRLDVAALALGIERVEGEG